MLVLFDSSDFLLVEKGDVVVLKGSADDWWLAYVIHIVGGSRNSQVNSLFQVVCVDTGVVRIVNADMVVRIVSKNTVR